MAANYGAVFTNMVSTDRMLGVWESLWAGAFTGKPAERVREAVRLCLKRCARPFSVADFETACAELAPHAAHQRNEEALALPSKTRADLLAEGAKRAGAAKQAAESGPRHTRSLENIRKGLWTRQDEEGYRQHAGLLGLRYVEPQWPEAAA